MLGRRLRQVLGSAALVTLLLWAATGVSLAGASDSCDLTVTPASGPPGTEFVFTGSGYAPTSLSLTREGSEPRVVPLPGTDPFTLSIVAGDTDVGKWKAVAIDPAAFCQGTTTLRITLPGTSTVADAVAADKTPVLAAFAGLAGIFVVSTAVLLRRSRRPV